MSSVGDLSLNELMQHIAAQPVDKKRIKGLTSGGSELDYATLTSAQTISATTEGGATTVVTGNSVTYDGSTVILLEFYAPTGGTDGTNLSGIFHNGTSSLGIFYREGGATTFPYMAYRYTPAAGALTHSVRFFRLSGTTANTNVTGGAGGAGSFGPAFLRITSV